MKAKVLLRGLSGPSADPPPCPEIYSEDLLTAAAATQSRRYIIHLFLIGYKTLVNYCLKCCPETQKDHAVCLGRE